MQNTITPLKKGDTVALIAPAGIIDSADTDVACEMLRSWGLKIWVGKNIEKSHSVFAGTDKERAKDLQFALDTNTIKAIVCARGGYGTIRTLDYISWDKFLLKPKLICGFSDITVIHSFLNKHAVPSLHSLMPINFPKASSEAIESFRKAIFGEPISYSAPSNALNKPGKCKGLLTGGNVSILMALRGTDLEPSFENKILFLEDVAETNYHLDRMMQNFKRSIFKQISGLIVGQFSEMKDGKTSFSKTAFEIVADATAAHNFPAFFDFPAGHVPDNRALWMNRPVEMDITKLKATVSFNE